MALVSLTQASKQFGNKIILNDINITINENERVAIVGKNGSGKSTLLSLINGRANLDSGERAIKKGLKILSLEQSPKFPKDASVKEVCLESLKELQDIHKRITEINNILDSNTKNENLDNINSKALLEELGNLTSLLDSVNGWDLEQKVKQTMNHFSLTELENRSAISLSGGEQKRLSLATLFLQPADLYILDEPTNHLDVEVIEFLESELLALKSSVLFISHDRYFIDSIAQRIIEIDNAKITNFIGGYAKYIESKTIMLENLAKEHEQLLKILRNEEAWFARGVQARRKRNEGRKARLMQLRIDAKTNPSLIRKMTLELERESKHFNRVESKNAQKLIYECENLNKKIGEKVLIKNLNLRILQHDKIAIVGKNGSGKSTLLKIILGEQKCDSGKVKQGELKIGYFDQQRNMLDDSKNLLETFCPNGGDHILVKGKNLHVFGYLKNFLFPKEMLNEKIGSLSGGEKNRVALALLFSKEYDCLILDEPTNDLDIATINILEEYLASFNGALIFVSHDRYFVDKLAKKLLIFGANLESNIEESYMQYSEYLDRQKEINELKELGIEINALPEFNKNPEKRMESKLKSNKPLLDKEMDSTLKAVLEYAPNDKLSDELKRIKKLSYKENLELEKLPNEIEILESKIAKLESDLCNPSIYEQVGVSVLANELEDSKIELESKIARYFELEEKLQMLKNRF